MMIDLSQLANSLAVTGSILGSVWLVGKNVSTEFGRALNKYGEKQVNAINIQRDIQGLAEKLSHLRGRHNQLDKNMHGELEESDKRFQQIEAQLNRVLGLLEGVSHGRRSGD